MRMAAVISLALLGGITGVARSEISEYLSDRQDLMVYIRQGWGELGINCAAHAPEQPGQRLRIKDQKFAAGLGHHASGEIIVDLSGQFIRFEAQVGVQRMPDSVGSVVFQVFVDDAKAFDSGVIRSSDPPKPVSVPLAGAQEMRLVVTDAGDGITCDCANWADARLVRDPAAKTTAEQEKIDVARFARVVTNEPGRLTGAQNSRVEEFSADDLYLDTDLYPDDQGRYLVPTDADGRGAIGLRWIERRQVRSLAIEFAQAPPAQLAEWTEVQYWIGKSPYQGRWKTLNGILVTQGDRWTFRVDARENPALRSGTWKIRWVLLTKDQPISVRRLQAFTASVIRTANLVLQFGSPDQGRQVELEMYNGEFVEPADSAGQTQARVAMAESIPVKVRYIDRRRWQSDRAVMRIRQPGSAFAVALDDVLSNQVV